MKLWLTICSVGLVLAILSLYLLFHSGKLSMQGSIRWNDESVFTICPHCDHGFKFGDHGGH